MSSNGYLTDADLSPAAGGIPGPDPGQGQLANDAAAAWNAMAAEILQVEGVYIRPNGPDSMYRPYDRQVYWRNYWCGLGQCQNAAVPGTSNHGLGLAADLPDYVQALVDKYGPKYGWNVACSDAPWEAWHRKWCGGWSGPDPGPTGTGTVVSYPTLKKGDHGDAVKRAQKHLRRWNVGISQPPGHGSDGFGFFGDKTRQAVVEFQIVHSLTSDGVVGPKTWKRLREKDHFLDKERVQINRLRLMRHGSHHGKDAKKIRQGRVWCAKEARAIRKTAKQYGWKGQHRRERYKVLHQIAGNIFHDTHL